jgi:hypothetical protein
VAQSDADQVRRSCAWRLAPGRLDKSEELKVRHLGRTLRFTDPRDWGDADIVAAYRSQGTFGERLLGR